MSRATTRTGGRAATTAVIPGRYALSVGRPDRPTPSGWAWTLLTDVARLETGHTPSRKHPEYWDGDVPWIGIKDAVQNHGFAIDDTYQHTNELGIANSSARLLPANTVCLSRTASVGYVVVMGKPMATSQDFVNWVCSDAIDHRFLKYVLVAEHETFPMFASGATHQTVYFPEVKAFHVMLPPLDTQRKIAAVLSAYDDLIANNTRRIAILEDMARTIYREWFVEFRYPGHEGVPLVESELGPIPEGWEATTTAGAFGFGGGATPSTKRPDFWDDGTINWYTPSDLTKHGQMFIGESGRKITEAGLDGCSATLFPPGSVMMTSRATLGVVSISETLACTNQGFITCLENERASGFFIYFWLGENARKMESVATGATFKEITKRAFRNVGLVLPNRELMDHFTETVGPMMCLGSSLIAHNAALKSTRDLLLPRLVSGEIDVSDLDIDIGVPL